MHSMDILQAVNALGAIVLIMIGSTVLTFGIGGRVAQWILRKGGEGK